MSEEIIERTFSVTLPARLKVSNIRGSVKIHTSETDQITVKAVKDVDSGDATETEIKIDQAPDGLVRVETDYHQRITFWNHKPCRVHYSIGVPRQCSLAMEVVAADAEVEGMEGAVRIHSVSGNVTSSDLTGSLDLRTISGDLLGESLRGPLDLDTVSGNIRLHDSQIESVHGKTVSGDIEAAFQPGNGPFEFRSVSGNVTLKVPAGAGYSASLSTQSGQLRTNGGGKAKDWGRGRYQADYFGGGRRITMRSVSGDLALRFVDEAGEPVQVEPSQAAPASAPGVNVSEILNQIESGELSVEEALKRLEK